MKIGKCEKLHCNLYDNKTYITGIKALKQALGQGLILNKAHSVTKFNQKENQRRTQIWAELRIKGKKWFGEGLLEVNE